MRNQYDFVHEWLEFGLLLQNGQENKQRIQINEYFDKD